MSHPARPHLRLVDGQTEPTGRSADAEESARASLAEGTRRRYAAAWALFGGWCGEDAGRVPIPAPPTMVSNYLAELRIRGLAASTLRVALAAINHHHVAAGHPPPGRDDEVKKGLAGDHRLIRRERRVRRKDGLVPGDLRVILRQLDLDTTRGARDRALVLVGYAAALRRSELIHLRVDDVDLHRERGGMRLYIRDAKTAKGDEAQFVDVRAGRDPDLCPVAALVAWLEAGGVREGSIFRRVRRGGRVGSEPLTGRSVSRIIRGLAAAAGLGGNYGGHSLRAGFVTAALDRDVPPASIQRVTRHASSQMIATYDRRRVVYVDAGL